MEKNLLTNIQNILNPISEKILYFYIGGSNLLSFVEPKNDNDLIVVCNSNEDRLSCKRYIKDTYGILGLRDQYNLDIRFTTEQYQQNEIYSSWYPYLVKERTYYRLDGTSFTETVSIEEFLAKKDIIKTSYLNFLSMLQERNEKLNDANTQSTWSIEKYYIKKIWYCLYITVCIFQNQSWELTEEQITTVNLLHDWQNLTIEIAKPIVDKLVEDINNL